MFFKTDIVFHIICIISEWQTKMGLIYDVKEMDFVKKILGINKNLIQIYNMDLFQIGLE
jgi:hypothetical protein